MVNAQHITYLYFVWVPIVPILWYFFQPPELTDLEKTEPVENDYFQAQFLLSLPVQGYYQVTIDSSLLDTQGILWHTGPQVTMSVRVDSKEGHQ